MSQQTYTVAHGVQTPAGPFSGGGGYTSGAVSQIVEEAIPTPSTNLQFSLTVDVSQIKVLFVLADQALTLKTNSTGSPANTLTLLAGKPYVWEHDSYYACPLTSDVTTIYVTNASGAAASLTFLVLYDPTP